MDNSPTIPIDLNTSDENIEENISDNNVHEQESDDAFTTLKSWCVENKDRLTIGSLNINSLPKD